MGGRGGTANRNAGNITIEVKDYWTQENLTSFESEEVEDAINEMRKSVKEVLERAEGDVDRAYEYLADYYPYALYDDDATKIVNNRDEHHIVGVDVRIHEWDGKIQVTLVPRVFSEDEFLTREELDAIGLTERRR